MKIKKLCPKPNLAKSYNPRFTNLPVFGNGKLQFHEETLSWQRELSPLSSATSVSGLTLAAIIMNYT